MAEDFDPYRKWLGIPPHEQPPNYYRLLGIGVFEADPDVIAEAADRQMAHVQRHKLGQYSALSQKLLNELATARLCLLNPDKRAAYERQLRATLVVQRNAGAASKSATRQAGSSGVRQAEPLAGTPAAAADAKPIAQAAAGKPAAPTDSVDGTFDFVQSADATNTSPRARKSAKSKPAANKTRLWIAAGSAAALLLVGVIMWAVRESRQPVARNKEPATGTHASQTQPRGDAGNKANGGEKNGSSGASEGHTPKPDEGAGENGTSGDTSPPSDPTPGGGDSTEFASSDITDLMPLVRPTPSLGAGKWLKNKYGLMLRVSDVTNSFLIVPYAPPNEYQLEVVVAPQPDAEFILGLVAGGKQFALILDGWAGEASGLHQIDNASGNENPSTHRGSVLKARRENRVLVTVRGDKIEVAANGEPIIQWQGPFERLGMGLPHAINDHRALFVAGTAKSAFQIRSLRLATLSGKGQELSAPTAPPSEVARVEPSPVQPQQPRTFEPVVTDPPANASQPPTPTPGAVALPGHVGPIFGIAVTPDSKQAFSIGRAVGDSPQSVQVWNLAARGSGGSFMVPNPRDTGDPSCGFAISPNGAQLFIGRRDNVWKVTADTHTTERPYACDGGNVFSIAVAANGERMCAGGNNRVTVCEVGDPNSSWRGFWSSPGGEAVTSVALTADSQGLLAVCGGSWADDGPHPSNDHRLHAVDLRNTAPGPGDLTFPKTVDLEGHTGSIWSVALSKDGTRAVTASNDSTLRVWDLKTRKSARVLNGHAGPVYAVAISSDGKLALSGGQDKTVRLWDLETGRELKHFDGSSDVIRAVALTPDNKWALAGGHDKLLHLWDLKSVSKQPRLAVKPKAKPGRLAVPDPAALEQATKLIRDVFADDFKQAKKPPERIALAEKLVKQSHEAQSDAERYALLNEARGQAVAGGSPSLMIQVVHQIADRFNVDLVQEVATPAEQMLKDSMPAASRRELAEGLLPLAETAAAEDNFEDAKRLCSIAVQSARKTNDNALIRQVTARSAKINEARKAYEAYQKALAQLKDSPDDGEAHLAVGRYLCFGRAEWQAGFEHLARGSDEPLKQIAALELKTPNQPDEQVKLADLWWALVENAKGNDRADFSERAEKWYSTALPALKGLNQTKVSKRLEELAGAKKSGPVASVEPEKPAATGGGAGGVNPAAGKLAPKIKLAIKKDSLARTANIAGRYGEAFAEIPPAGLILAGFNFTVNNDFTPTITSVQPIYWSSRGSVNGAVWGVAVGQPQTVMAKKGYAVSGVRGGGGGDDVYWIEVIFAKLGPNGLDMSDKYNSTWEGTQYNGTVTMGDNGQLVVGIRGAATRYQLTGLGLVQMPAN